VSTTDHPTAKTEQLIAGARAGDERAWRALFERSQVFLLVRLEIEMPGFLRRTSSPEDVLQEAFLKVTQKLDTFEYKGEGSFRRWLNQIVQNEMKNLVRHWHVEHDRLRPITGSHVEGLAGGGASPSQILARIGEQEHLLALLRELPSEDQDLLIMRIFEEKSWEEVGLVLGCCRDTASERFDRVIARMGRELQ
jgi:RNA polymerase sigma-70 factor (ECF subfamily)